MQSLLEKIESNIEDYLFGDKDFAVEDLIIQCFCTFKLVSFYKKEKLKISFLSYLIKRTKESAKKLTEDFLKQIVETDFAKFVLRISNEGLLTSNAEKVRNGGVAEFANLVADKIFYVQFTKTDGTLRSMFAQLPDPDKKEEFDISKVDTSKDYIRVYDVDAEGYRTIKIKTIQKIAAYSDLKDIE